MDAIEHTATPVHFSAVEPSEMIDPAVAGTKSILESARKHGTGVKRVVITSSTGAVLNTLPDSTLMEVFDETSWNDLAVEDCEKKGKDAFAMSKYRASKVLAERAAWKFMEQHKESLPFDLVAIAPPFVFGPFLHEVEKPESLNVSLAEWRHAVVSRAVDDVTLVSRTCVLF